MKTVKNIMYSIDHTIDRMKSRYGLTIDVEDYIMLCERVKHKLEIKFISEEKQKKDIQKIYDMSFQDTIIRVVWSEANKCIKTVLPI